MTKKLRKDILQWDVNSWIKALKFWEKNTDWKNVHNSLELGSRQRGISLGLALKGKKVVCSDLKNVQSTAEPLHIRYEVAQRISYQDIDATEIPYKNHFDLIIFKSIIGGMGKDDEFEKELNVFDSILKALKPAGKLLFAENLAASSMYQALRKRFVEWGDSWRYISLGEMHSFLERFSSFHIKTTGVTATFGRNEKQRSILSSADRFLFNQFSPKKWKYISYGIATK